MALFPKIDQPCPLGIDEQRRIAGYCGHCSKAVHALNAMSDSDRVGLLRNANGPICVSYRVPMRRGMAAGLGAAALALSMAGPVRATDTQALPAGDVQATDSTQQSVVPPAVSPLAENAPLESIALTGGVSDPSSVVFVDEDDVPDLPMIETAPAKR